MSKIISKSDINPLALLSDEPINELGQDGLGLESWARVVAGVAIGTEGPFTVGVFGQWGVGKTSILRLAQQLVNNSQQSGQGNITTVTFNAWQYEQESNPVIPLIASIIFELDKSKGVVKKTKDEAGKLRDALRAILFGVSTNIKGKVPLVGEAGVSLDSNKAIEQYDKLRSQWIDEQIDQSFSYNALKALRELQKEKKGTQRHKIVVFIDDLDRCFPDKAIQLLEGVKLILNHPGFIFVLAVDRTILENYLDKRYSEDFGLKDYGHGQSYLDKIIQLPLWIPPHERRFDYMIESLLERPLLEKQRGVLEPLIKVIGLSCAFNPRQLVRFINDILVGRHIYELANFEGEFPLSAFVVAHGIRHQSDLIYQELLHNQSLCNKIKVCKEIDSLQALLTKLIKGTKPQDRIGIALRSLQDREPLTRLLTSDAGRGWLESEQLRGRIDSFVATGWNNPGKKGDEIKWIRAQVERALIQLESTNDDEVIAACHILSVLGDHTCFPALKKAKSNWRANSRVAKIIFATYQKLHFSYGVANIDNLVIPQL